MLADLTDEILFGDVERPQLSKRDRSEPRASKATAPKSGDDPGLT
jgi:hypothetical protein